MVLKQVSWLLLSKYAWIFDQYLSPWQDTESHKGSDSLFGPKHLPQCLTQERYLNISLLNDQINE